MKSSVIPLIIAALSAPAFAQLTDAPAVDLKQVLQGLRQFKEQNETGLKTRRNTAYQQIVAAAASNEKAAAMWTNAVMAVEFAGVERETSAARGWTKGEGEGLKAKEGANAARLHLVWLGLTLQHASGAETKDLLRSVIDYTKQLDADDAAIGHVVEQLKRKLDSTPALRGLANLDLREPRDLNRLKSELSKMAAGKPIPGVKEALEDVRIKILHDKIMKAAVAKGAVAQSLQIEEIMGDAGKSRKKNDDSGEASWEPVPGNVDGIYSAIILPEFRDTRDPRLIDYWDLMLRKGQEGIYAGMPAFQEKQWSQVSKPIMLWSRTQDMLLIGLKNRAITEMFNIIKAYPQHQDAANWIKQLEQVLSPSTPAPAGTSQGSGTVAPPTAIPAATTPGNPPTAVIVPASPAGVR